MSSTETGWLCVMSGTGTHVGFAGTRMTLIRTPRYVLLSRYAPAPACPVLTDHFVLPRVRTTISPTSRSRSSIAPGTTPLCYASSTAIPMGLRTYATCGTEPGYAATADATYGTELGYAVTCLCSVQA
eukprot:2046981-Rhodomonas_salina.2